ncbi:hypothetical protein BU23DRAFT_553137 [Bimuria novae-zelandiae CBS 107.79]|uniref:Uncharacterized protein n=1 Tax=Bimuria novae-zelandiae CBS 107.79 TaxID=1447943 RepID=A0A6A5VCN1_9PLEO|nr:hypothetical protein BU23DRAFT_553137 [Bimuria novae-zelandiae CBS 107.79]
MPAIPAATPGKKAGAPTQAVPADDANRTVRLHITPFNPALLKVYLPPSVLPVAKNISYHAVETFPEKGFGYVELPVMEAQKLKKKLNGSTLKGSKVKIEEAKPEKRKLMEAERAEAEEEEERPAKRAKKDRKKKKKEDGVLEGVELPGERKVKRGWTEVPAKGKKDKKEKKDKENDKDKKAKRKESKYTKEPEVLFKAKLTPVAATEVARKDKKEKKKEKKRAQSKQEVIVHEFEKNTKTPSFLKATKVDTDKKPALDYVNGRGWVDEDGNVVEAETGKAKNRRVLELVEPGPEEPKSKSKKHSSATPSPKASPAPKSSKKEKKKAKKVTPPPESSESESESEESSVVSSSSDSDSDASPGGSEPTSPTTPAPAKAKSNTPEIAITPSHAKKEIHPLEALFKKPKPAPLLTPGSNPTSTPAKSLAPINTSFSFFDGDGDVDMEEGAAEENIGESERGVPFTPQTQRDIEFRGLRSAAPTPDTAAIGRRFSFPWRNSSHESNPDDSADDEEAEKQLSSNTKANAASGAQMALPDVVEEDEEEVQGVVDGDGGEGEKEGKEEGEESEFQKWFWENQGGLNRAWKRRRKEAVKAKRSVENRRAVGGARRGA